MSILNKIKSFFNKKDEFKEYEESEMREVRDLDSEQIQEETKELDKFDAEFHNPRLQCFYCIESGRVRFFKAPGQREESAFHKRCFKKLKEGKLPQ